MGLTADIAIADVTRMYRGARFQIIQMSLATTASLIRQQSAAPILCIHLDDEYQLFIVLAQY